MKKKAKRIAYQMRNFSWETIGQMVVDECKGVRYDLYTDGSCKDGVGGCAWLVLHKGAVVKSGKEKVTFHCNSSVYAELRAIVLGLGDCPRSCSVDVYTDCQAVISKIRAGKLGDLISIYNKVCEGKVVRYHWVRAHKGDECNEMVDSLAFSVIRC